MIADPIYQGLDDKYGDSYLDNLIEKNNGKDIFIVTKQIRIRIGNGLPHQVLSLQNCDCGSLNCHFMIFSNGGRHIYFAMYKSRTRSEFLDLMKSNYPDYFEWLLFHPEWTS